MERTDIVKSITNFQSESTCIGKEYCQPGMANCSECADKLLARYEADLQLSLLSEIKDKYALRVQGLEMVQKVRKLNRNQAKYLTMIIDECRKWLKVIEKKETEITNAISEKWGETENAENNG